MNRPDRDSESETVESVSEKVNQFGNLRAHAYHKHKTASIEAGTVGLFRLCENLANSFSDLNAEGKIELVGVQFVEVPVK